MLPAVGQGALGIEQRADDRAVGELLAPLSHPDTKILVTAERGVMLAINGNCTTPVAAFGLRQGDSLHLRAFLAEPDGSRPRSAQTTVPFPENAETAAEIGRSLGAQLL
jgi:hydroxymethylbilane synthase